MAGCACFSAMNKQWVAHVPFAIKIACLHFIVSFNFSVDKPMYLPWFEIQPDLMASIADLVYDAMFGLYMLICVMRITNIIHELTKINANILHNNHGFSKT